MFTGSTHTGRTVARQAADRLIAGSMELGGKNAMIVLEDADIGKAVEGAERALFSNAGQLCISIERLYVHEAIAEEYVRRLAEHTRGMRLGAELDYGPDMGSLISADQLEIVRGHVEDAVAKGAHVLTGGRPRPDLGPYFYEPTLLQDVREDMTLFADETFGPVVAISTFGGEDEVVARANDSVYGLNFSVWTERPRARARARHAAAGRHGERQRGLRGDVGVGRRARWAGSSSPAWAAATAATASRSTPRRRRSPSSGCCRSRRRPDEPEALGAAHDARAAPAAPRARRALVRDRLAGRRWVPRFAADRARGQLPAVGGDGNRPAFLEAPGSVDLGAAGEVDGGGCDRRSLVGGGEARGVADVGQRGRAFEQSRRRAVALTTNVEGARCGGSGCWMRAALEMEGPAVWLVVLRGRSCRGGRKPPQGASVTRSRGAERCGKRRAVERVRCGPRRRTQ